MVVFGLMYGFGLDMVYYFFVLFYYVVLLWFGMVIYFFGGIVVIVWWFDVEVFLVIFVDLYVMYL